MKQSLLAVCCLLWAVTCYAQTALRPDQISPATPDITWAPGGPGYQIGSTVPWRTSASSTPTFLATDAASVVELTGCAGGCTATLPLTSTTGFGDGFGFSIQVAAGSLTLAATSPQKINGKSQITVGSYQLISLLSRSGWYAELSVPQPSTQTGANVLADNMTWITPPSGGGPTLTAINLSGSGFATGTAGTVGTATTNLAGSFTGTWSLQTSGTDHTSATCNNYGANFAINSSTGILTNTTGAAAGSNAGVCIVATQAGAVGSPFVQAETITGSSTYNPADKTGSVTLSGGNLTATAGASADAFARTVGSHSTGKYYFEVKATTATGGSDYAAGLAIASTVAGDGATSNNLAISYVSGAVYINGTQQGVNLLGNWSGQTLGVAVDLGAGQIWLRVNAGNWNASGTANPATNTGGFTIGLTGPFYGWTSFSATGNAATANFGGSAYAFTAPAGFGAF